MNRVAIIDYGLCNLDSICRAVEKCSGHPKIVNDPCGLAEADRIILPGVGAYATAMANLRKAGFAEALPEAVLSHGRPLLGICLGMQLLGEEGTEGAPTKGLGLLRGRVTRMRSDEGTGCERVPHIGWNDVTVLQSMALFEGISQNVDFYFAHSYRLESPAEETLGIVSYCGRTVAAAACGNIMATQFHPEKSQAAGFRLLQNFLSYAAC